MSFVWMAARISSLNYPCCHSESFAVILSGAKNLALDFSAEKEQGEMLRRVCPERSERAQHDIPESSMTTDNFAPHDRASFRF
jgi:hypothetical protein